MKKIGAVLVVGGGIAGMQSALDLANAGFKVYLAEDSPAIGGRMAQLDKTFPTNDCAMCTISPRLVEVDKHPNIEIITCSEVQSIEGVPGDFTAKILQKPRFIDMEKCNACGDCATVCPIKLPNQFDENLGDITAAHKHYPQAIPNKFVISKEGTSPCRIGCPAGVNGNAYVALLSQKKYPEALEVIRRVLPFAAICGRLCHHPCETECNRKDVDESVSIRYLKRFIADKVREKGEKPVELLPITKSEKVAIVGAGPAGLTCGLRLKEKGYDVTIFEASDKPGGMFTSCIPDYRVPKDTADYEIKRILDTGIELKTNTKVGKPARPGDQSGGDITLAELSNKYKSVFISIGYQDAAKIPLEGSETAGVFYGIDFLREAKRLTDEGTKELKNERTSSSVSSFIGSSVLVIGGGNVAIDCAKSALRLGAREVNIVYRRSKAEMPAYPWEIEEALEEDIKITYLSAPNKVLETNGKITGLECLKMELSEPDASGRRRPIPIKGSEFIITADTIIIATGQRADTTGFDELEKTPFRTIKVDPITFETSVKGVFAGGDIVRGPASVIEAVAQGNEAAISIERFLTGADMKEGRGEKKEGLPLPERKIEKKARLKIPMESPEVRKKSFMEVEKLIDEETAVAEASRCLSCSVCCECLQCVTACQPKAVFHDMKPKVRELSVGALVLTTGGDMFDARLKGEYGFGRYPNVVTSIQYERILSASGPFDGRISRPSDEGHPKRIAWIQCVGSRDHSTRLNDPVGQVGNDYCSSVCCMYATKQAIITKEHESDIDVSVFYNDLRSFGKGYEYYTTSARQKGVKYTKAIISNIKEIPGTNSLAITYLDESNHIKEEVVDMVVLSVGFTPSKQGRKLCKNLGVELNQFGFSALGGSASGGNAEQEFSFGKTNKEGIYAAGVFSGPMDIPESVMGASGASALAGELLASARNTLVTQKTYPPERDIKGEEPRVGVFICRCGTNIARVVDVQSLVDFVKKLPDVIYTEENLYTCSTDTQQHIIDMIHEHKLNRVIVSSCTPRTHEPLFQEMLCEAGLNKYLFEMANIRDQCSWVHMDLPLEATEKAKDLVKMAVNRARYLEPLKEQSFVVIQSALVVGGGLSGLTSALSLARQGFMTYLIEKTDKLGGNLLNVTSTLSGANPQEYIKKLVAEAEKEPLLKIYKNALLIETNGSIGNYKSKIKYNDKTEEIEHGVIIVAIGGVEAKPTSYMYGQSPNVITQMELEKKQDLQSVKSAVMIQCVECRDEKYPYCSRICCTQAIKNAIRIKKINPETNVYILYRDIMTYGMWEIYYRQARELGVIFIRYEIDKKPLITQTKDGKLSVNIFEGLLQKEITIPTDLLVLSMPVRPQPDAQVLGTTLKVPLNTEGFFLEAHLKLRPLDFANEGMFLAGLAHFPKHISESIAQAKGVAARAATVLSKKQMTISGIIAQVDPNECIACLTCVRECPFNVPKIIHPVRSHPESIRDANPPEAGRTSNGVKNASPSDRDIPDTSVAFIEPSLCHGCGVCVSACPRKAIQLAHYKDNQLVAKCEIYNK